MRRVYLNYSVIFSAMFSAVFYLTAAGVGQTQTVTPSLTSSSTSTLATSVTPTTYNCFLDRNGDGSYTDAGEIGICTQVTGTVSGELCPLDVTDCVISMPTPTTCPSNATYDASVNKCVMPPVCSVGTFDKTTNMCVSKFLGTCPSGASIDPSTGDCVATPSCSSGSYNVALQKCVSTSVPVCPPGTALNGTTNRCEAVPACPPGGAYSSTNEMCLYSPNSNLPPVCPSGSVLDPSTGECKTASYYGGICPDNAGVSVMRSVPTCELATSTCPSGASYNSNTGMCDYPNQTPICPSGTSLDFDLCDTNVSYDTYGDETCPSGLSVQYISPYSSSVNAGMDMCVAPNPPYPGCPSGWTSQTVYGSGGWFGWQTVTGVTCVRAPDYPLCPNGMTYSAEYRACTVTVTCPPGSQLNPNATSAQDACIAYTYTKACPAGFTVDAVSGMCDAVPACPAGSSLDSNTNLCAAAPTCSAGSYDVLSKGCVDTSTPPACPANTTFNPATGLCDAFPTCTHGEFDPSQGVCIYTVLPACPFGGSFNLTRQRCEAIPSCSSGDVNPSSSMCAFTGPALYPANCLTGTALNTVTHVCDTAPQCATGTYDPTQITCEITQVNYVPPTCPSGMTFDASLNECTTAPLPVGYSFYATADNEFTLYLDGNAILSGTAWWVTYSTTMSLAAGSHTVQINASDDGIGALGILFALHENADGTWPVVSDSSWNTVTQNYGNVGVGPWGFPSGWPKAASQWIWGVGWPSTSVTKSFNVPGTCASGQTYDAAQNLCTSAPICGPGTYDPTTKQCKVLTTATGTPSCIAGTTLNSSSGRCETAPTCTKGTFDPKYDACASYDRTCPLGSQYPCLNNNGIYQCSALACEDSSTLTQTDNDNQPTGYQSNNGSIDPTTGQCNGQLVIFPGKPSYCKPPGFRTLGTNCCSAAHGGKFSRYEDLNQVIDQALAKYKVFTNTTITNDGKNIAIDTSYMGNTSAAPDHQSYTVTAGTPTTWEEVIVDSGNDPTLQPDAIIDYSSVTDSGGMTTISTTVSPGYGWVTVYDAQNNLVSNTKFKEKATDLEQKFGFDSTTGNNVNDVAVTQYNYTQASTGAYDPATKTTTFGPTENVIYSIDTSNATCSIKNPSFEGYSQCQLQCTTGLSNGNLIIRVVYRYLPTGDIISNPATVTKSVSGTSAQIDTDPTGCEDWISYGYRTYGANGVKEPFVTASTAYNTDGTFNNNTILAAESMGDLHTWPSLWSVLIAYASYITSPCRPHEQATDLARDAGKCHYLGRFCISHWGHYCVQDKESYCCFGSKLARIIQEQGRPQLSAFGPDGGWGQPESPDCIGLTPDQFSMLDFSKMDLSEFYADIVPPNAAQIQQNISNGINNFYSNTINGGRSGSGSVISVPTGSSPTSLVSSPTGT